MTQTEAGAGYTTRVELTDDELLRLDGTCSTEAQRAVDAAKLRSVIASRHPSLTRAQIALVAKTVSVARTEGKLSYIGVPLSPCVVCGDGGGYVKYTRGARKGQSNFNAPCNVWGIELARQFIGVRGSARCGCCTRCLATILPALRTELADIQAELPEALMGVPPKWKWNANMRCTECAWMGHEGEMGQSPAMMGLGMYPSTCPKCGAKNIPLGPTRVKRDEGHTVTAAIRKEGT